MPPLQRSKDAVVLLLGRAETGRSWTITDDAQLRRAQPQAGDGSGYYSPSERPQDELGRASGGRHISQLVVERGQSGDAAGAPPHPNYEHATVVDDG